MQKRHNSIANALELRLICIKPSVNSPHKGAVTRKMFSFDDVIMYVST